MRPLRQAIRRLVRQCDAAHTAPAASRDDDDRHDDEEGSGRAVWPRRRTL